MGNSTKNRTCWRGHKLQVDINNKLYSELLETAGNATIIGFVGDHSWAKYGPMRVILSNIGICCDGLYSSKNKDLAIVICCCLLYYRTLNPQVWGSSP